MPVVVVGNLSVTLLYEFRAWPQLIGVSVRTSWLTFLCSRVTNGYGYILASVVLTANKVNYEVVA